MSVAKLQALESEICKLREAQSRLMFDMAREDGYPLVTVFNNEARYHGIRKMKRIAGGEKRQFFYDQPQGKFFVSTGKTLVPEHKRHYFVVHHLKPLSGRTWEELLEVMRKERRRSGPERKEV